MSTGDVLALVQQFPLVGVGGLLFVFVLVVAVLVQRRGIKIGNFELSAPVQSGDPKPAMPQFLGAAAARRSTPQLPQLKSSPDGKIGYNLQLGGICNDQPLLVLASDWLPFSNGGALCFGYLYDDAGEGPTCPQVFFKAHVNPSGDGYIHIASVGSPPQTIWLQAPGQPRLREVLHFAQVPRYPNHPAILLWPYRWK